MTIYDVYFRTDLQWAKEQAVAETPVQALEFARRFAHERFDDLDFQSYEDCDSPINEIEICDAEYTRLAIWHDDDLRLRIAARDLLDAAELVVARGERGDLAGAIRQLEAAIAKAKGGAA